MRLTRVAYTLLQANMGVERGLFRDYAALYRSFRLTSTNDCLFPLWWLALGKPNPDPKGPKYPYMGYLFMASISGAGVIFDVFWLAVWTLA